MKNKIVGIILMSAMTCQLVACGSAATANAEGMTVEAVTETPGTENQVAESKESETPAETVYTDGTGSIKIVDANTIMWNDDQEHVADEVEMTR